MSFYLDTQETTERFSSHVTGFRSLLDTDHVRHGSIEDLFEFAKTLESSNQFRLDLSALVKSVVNSERQEILLTDMMNIIAISVGGESVADTRTDMTGPTRALMEFLLGTGCWKQFGSAPRPISRSPAEKPIKPPLASEDSIPIRSSVPVSTIAVENTEDRASLHDISNELRQTLTRLESSTEQVRHHLDSIERRIGQIELAPQAQPARTSVGLEPLVHRGTGNESPSTRAQSPVAQSTVVRYSVDETPVLEPELPTRGRAVFSHTPDPSSRDDDFSSPTFAYGTEAGRSRVLLWIFIALVVLGAAIFLFLHFGDGAAVLKTGISNLKTDYANSSAPASSSVAATSSAPAAAAPASGRSAAGARSSPTTQPQGDAAKNTDETTPLHSATSDNTSSNNSPETRSTSDGSNVRYVQSKVMEGYLISAPRPEYPPEARRDHIEGQVALQATISRSGSIETLHFIKGPALLRGASIDAVRHWRYRPYSVDGQAMKVATTIYVDFNLRPPPAIVH